jgi:hypothetical protein
MTEYYPDWQAAAEASRSRMAIADPIYAELASGMILRVRLVKPLRGDPFFTYASCPGLPVKNLPAKVKDVDKTERWKPF